MKCPICKGETTVLATDGAARRRKCTSGCAHRFNTVEVLKEDHQRLQAIVQDAAALAEKVAKAA